MEKETKIPLHERPLHERDEKQSLTKEEIIEMMRNSESKEEWDANHEKVYGMFHGVNPKWWFEEIDLGGVRVEAEKKWLEKREKEREKIERENRNILMQKKLETLLSEGYTSDAKKLIDSAEKNEILLDLDSAFRNAIEISSKNYISRIKELVAFWAKNKGIE